ncbi:MAG: class I SAM-dependent methyltransferase [Caldimonas sp.]
MTDASPWVARWAYLIAPGGTVLDVAAGSGRHTAFLAARGHAVTAIDRDSAALQPLAAFATTLVADIEKGPWPLAGRTFDAVVVTHYLWRPLFAELLAALAPGGVLIYETFAAGNETVGRPARPEFLLARGELLRAAAGLRIVAFEDGFLGNPERFVQRIVAAREIAAARPMRFPLDGPAVAGGSLESSDSGKHA